MVDEQFKQVKQQILDPAELNEDKLQTILEKILCYRVDQADLYIQSAQSESWILEEGLVKVGHYDLDQGVGVRVISGEKTGFAYSDDLIFPALEQASVAARSIAQQGGGRSLQAWHRTSGLQLYQPVNPIAAWPDQQKVNVLMQVDQLARQVDPRIKKVTASLSSTYELILIMNSDGRLATDIRPLVRLGVQVIAEAQGRLEQGSSGGGGRYDYHYFTLDRIQDYVTQATQQAIVNLQAAPAPAGTMPVVLGPGWPGVLLHEAIGHGLEGDFNRKGTSAFAGRLGEQVASALCTIVDDGTIAGRRGSLSVDDEGTETQKTVLIEQGILKNYMQDNMNARLMGMKSTGNGRRESYAHIPMPRMTNTYMLPGHHTPNDIIASVDKGLYAVQFDGGQVDITSGKFVFSTSEAYLIEKGKITRPVKGATLIGNGPDVLTKVSMVGNNLELDSGIGVCGKEGQQVPVGVGQPTLKIEKLTVGGTK
jgi:TldD protein